MTSPSDHDHASMQVRETSREQTVATSRAPKAAVAIAALICVGMMTAGCSHSGGHNSRSSTSSSASSTGMAAQALAYSRCMRSHGVSNFPDPTLSGGNVTFKITLNQSTATYQAAARACQSLLPGAHQTSTVSAQQLAADVAWANCMRTHGVPSFPDPNAQGAFDSSEFDPTSTAFQAANHACKSLQPGGAVAAVPGSGPG